MISGRQPRPHGGTLDKLESIPGYQATPSSSASGRWLPRSACAIIGQTADLAPPTAALCAARRDGDGRVGPADHRLDPVEELAAGLDGLVMDVKFGSGAFAADLTMARELAASIASVGSGAGLPTVALLTDMNQVLGRHAGNSLELHETSTTCPVASASRGCTRWCWRSVARCCV